MARSLQEEAPCPVGTLPTRAALGVSTNRHDPWRLRLAVDSIYPSGHPDANRRSNNRAGRMGNQYGSAVGRRLPMDDPLPGPIGARLPVRPDCKGHLEGTA